jgi:hypothetical protein
MLPTKEPPLLNCRRKINYKKTNETVDKILQNGEKIYDLFYLVYFSLGGGRPNFNLELSNLELSNPEE